MNFRLLIPAVLTLVTFILPGGAANAAIPAGERQALQDLYTSTFGAGWGTSTGWNGPAGTECTWFGVTCDGGQTTVTEISLFNNNLGGQIPPTIVDLVGMTSLDLGGNRLSGTVPSFASNTALQYLLLDGNRLSGTIPSFASNTALQYLFLSYNQLSGAIPSFASNTALVYLYLQHNQLSGAIPSFASNTALQRLYLYSNHLSGTIPPFASNTALQYLGLSKNQLSGTIPSFASNTALRRLNLKENQLSGAIPSFGTNTALHYLDLSKNQLSAIPSFARNTALTELRLEYNKLSGAIPSFASNTALLLLDLYSNQLSGAIPSFASNTHLMYLYLYYNQLSGAIPSFASNAGLQRLSLRGNQLTGQVHPSLGTLTNLVDSGLDLRWNALFSTDAALTAFLDSRQVGGDWQSSQTIPVTGLGVSGLLPMQVTVDWTPIVYSGDTGYYQVFYSTLSGGPYSPFATVTASKTATSLTVTGLAPLTPYFFVVQTTTAPHANNPNTVLSGFSAEVSSATTPVELIRLEVE